MNRFRKWLVLLSVVGLLGCQSPGKRVGEFATSRKPPNVLVIIADQWRFNASGFAGNEDVRTPHLDRLAARSVHFVNAISSLPVCSPMRASFLTGQRPLTHGVFLNDVPLDPGANTIAKVFKRRGYDTGYIGKWHVNGDGRSAFIPVERRQGFDYWKVLECTHEYNRSAYYADGPEKLQWEGYDAIAQTRDAQAFLRARGQDLKPFFLVLAWGPPHDPYFTAPENYRSIYTAERLKIAPNVPESTRTETQRILAGYYAHCTALDDCIGELRRTLSENELDENTIILFTSDHGDMLGSQGMFKKQKPFDESIRVPLLIHWPSTLRARAVEHPICPEDLMPTLLGLCKIEIPATVEGYDFGSYLRMKGKAPGDGTALISCVAPFGEWERRRGGKEFRGVRTSRYTYVRDLNGPWLLFDNQQDPFQTNNLVNLPAQQPLQTQLEAALSAKLRACRDEFLPGEAYIRRWGYTVNANGTVPYTP